MPMPDAWRLAVRVVAALCMAMIIAGCATPPSRQNVVRIILYASAGLNPDRNGRPSPVMVRVYELTDADDFQQADFFNLYEHDKDVLGNAIVARMIVAVRPGERLSLSHDLDARSRHLAVLVAYRDIYHARWRAIVDLPPSGDSTWRVVLSADGVAVEPGGSYPRPSDPPDAVKAVKPQWDKLTGTTGSAIGASAAKAAQAIAKEGSDVLKEVKGALEQ